MTILQMALLQLITQFVFIGARTWNVIAIAKGDICRAAISGAIVHIAWLVSITIGVVSMTEIMMNFRLDYLPIVLCSLAGGVVATIIVMKLQPTIRKYKKHRP